MHRILPITRKKASAAAIDAALSTTSTESTTSISPEPTNITPFTNQETKNQQPPTTLDGLAALKWLHKENFIGANQFKFIGHLIRTSEEQDFFIQRMIDLKKEIETMPATYDQSESEDPIVHLHYFGSNYNAYIYEKDKGADGDKPEHKQSQAYGFARFEHMPECAECGYISLPEILATGKIEIDLHFKPTPLSEIKAEYARIKDPKPKLKPNTIYAADNGRLICLQCAGNSAKFTGRDISGQKVMTVPRSENATWKQKFNEDMTCESGCTSYS